MCKLITFQEGPLESPLEVYSTYGLIGGELISFHFSIFPFKDVAFSLYFILCLSGGKKSSCKSWTFLVTFIARYLKFVHGFFSCE